MSPRTVRTLPTVQPILLTPRRDPFDDPAWLFEPKYDGYRGLLYVTRKSCHFRSERGNMLKPFQAPARPAVNNPLADNRLELTY